MCDFGLNKHMKKAGLKQVKGIDAYPPPKKEDKFAIEDENLDKTKTIPKDNTSL